MKTMRPMRNPAGRGGSSRRPSPMLAPSRADDPSAGHEHSGDEEDNGHPRQPGADGHGDAVARAARARPGRTGRSRWSCRSIGILARERDARLATSTFLTSFDDRARVARRSRRCALDRDRGVRVALEGRDELRRGSRAKRLRPDRGEGVRGHELAHGVAMRVWIPASAGLHAGGRGRSRPPAGSPSCLDAVEDLVREPSMSTCSLIAATTSSVTNCLHGRGRRPAVRRWRRTCRCRSAAFVAQLATTAAGASTRPMTMSPTDSTVHQRLVRRLRAAGGTTGGTRFDGLRRSCGARVSRSLRSCSFSAARRSTSAQLGRLQPGGLARRACRPRRAGIPSGGRSPR